MKFLIYHGRHGERYLVEHSPRGWEYLRAEQDADNRMTPEEIRDEFGDDALYGSLEYRENAHFSIDDGGSIETIEVTEV